MCFHCLRSYDTAFALCVSTVFAAKTLPLPCVSTVFAAKTVLVLAVLRLQLRDDSPELLPAGRAPTTTPPHPACTPSRSTCSFSPPRHTHRTLHSLHKLLARPTYTPSLELAVYGSCSPLCAGRFVPYLSRTAGAVPLSPWCDLTQGGDTFVTNAECVSKHGRNIQHSRVFVCSLCPIPMLSWCTAETSSGCQSPEGTASADAPAA